MLRISKLTDYAILIMSQMARYPDTVMSAAMLADALHLTLPTVSKILKMLLDVDLVKSVRGAVGGYHLARASEKITVADIIAGMEGGELALMECCDAVSLCTIESMCTLQKNWQIINKIIGSFLAKITILDMVEPLSLQGRGV
jgi:FeS assembly SUF system regulator